MISVISFKAAFGYSAVETFTARVLDLIILWTVLGTLPQNDLALFGLATSSLFIFNFVFYAPETALLRSQNTWKSGLDLERQLSAFISFANMKLICHIFMAVFAMVIFGAQHWLTYAVIFSFATQNIQLAEIARIHLRLELRQKEVALYESCSRLVLCLACMTLFVSSGIDIYMTIFLLWSFVVSRGWLNVLKKHVALSKPSRGEVFKRVWSASVDYSFWAHLIGVVTLAIYNSSVLCLELFGVPRSDIATFTVVNRVSNLFMVLPMFVAAFVPVILTNSGENFWRPLKKTFLLTWGLSTLQLLFFMLFASQIGAVFGVNGAEAEAKFRWCGIAINVGIFLLNLVRPLTVFLMIRSSPKSLLLKVFLPSLVLALVAYTIGAAQFGIVGSAVAMLGVCAVLAVAVILRFIWLVSRPPGDGLVGCAAKP